jgi:hypothetical protein
MVCFNTSGIIDAINDKKKNIFKIGYSLMSNNVKKYQRHCWRSIFKLETQPIFNQKNYIFYNQIQTDGISCCLLFIDKDYYNKTYGQRVPEYDEDIDLMIEELGDLTKEECIKFQNKKLIGIDPGKKSVLTMIDENDKIYEYSNCRRRFETFTKRSNQITLNEKNKNNIIELETELSNFNKRTLHSNKFVDFLNEKKKHFNKLQEFYERPLFRKLSFRRYSKTKSSEDKMLNEIEKKYGNKDDILIGLGDWSKKSNTQMKGCMPSPNKGLIKVLKKRFEVLSVDEFRTSKLYSRGTKGAQAEPAFGELINVKVKGKSIHTLLTPKENPNGVILNRDTNASKNILFLLKEYLYFQRRPLEFQRPKKLVNS